MSVSAEGAGNAQMGVLGHGQQWNIFGGADNRDVVVVIEHESDEIAVQIDTDTRLSVEITNHTRYAKQLSLRVNGVPKGVAILDRTEVLVRPGETTWVTLTVRCMSTTPKAGKRALEVVAVDDASGLQWPSRAKTIAIPPRPDVRLVLMGPANVARAGTYPARMQLSNVGNTMVKGGVRHAEADTAGTLTPQVLFRPGYGSTAAFEVGPGESAAFDIDITFPTQGWRRRRWEMLFRLTVDRNDTRDSYHHFWLEQPGRLTELWLAGSQIGGKHPPAWRRGALLSGLVAVTAVLVISVFAIVSSLTPDKNEGTGGGGATASAAAAPSFDRRATPDIYSPLKCSPGQWIVFIGTMAGDRADEEAQMVLDHETARLRWVLENQQDQFESSRPVRSTPCTRARWTTFVQTRAVTSETRSRNAGSSGSNRSWRARRTLNASAWT